MRGINSIDLKRIFVGMFCMFTAAVSVCFAEILFFARRALPQGMEEYYLDVSGLSMTDGLVVLSPSDFQNRLVSSEGLGGLFFGRTRAALGLFLCVVIVLVVILGIILWKIYSYKVVQPVKRLSEELENMARARSGAAGEGAVKVREEAASLPKELECLRQATDTLSESVGAAYSDFSHLGRYVSHEYKNTMALLRAKAQNGNMEGITQTVDKLVKDMDDILTLCAGREQGFDEVVDLALVCGTAVDEYAKGDVRIEFSFDEDCDTGVRGNELWIYRAVCNLIDNAVKYGQDGKVYVAVGVKNDCPFVEVSDAGIGIDREDEERIFDEGYRIGELKKDGYGIGLSLVKHVAWLCNAFLWVRSEKNVGSSFKLVFPRP